MPGRFLHRHASTGDDEQRPVQQPAEEPTEELLYDPFPARSVSPDAEERSYNPPA